MNQSAILILPGLFDFESAPSEGTKNLPKCEHWQSIWLKKYPNVIKVSQKNWTYADKKEWTKNLNEYIEKQKDKEIILIGHSVACATIVHWSNDYFSKISAKIKGALLVGPTDLDLVNTITEMNNMWPMPLLPLKFKSILVVSDNDSWVSLDRAKYFAKCWGSELVNAGSHKHINVDAGFGEWPEGEKLLQKLME
ncbi:MAG: hypothetical protein UY05_C0012G0007 [Candidatus Peregrinibacteria bacterium GW2011_GWA2_47_7]|nr:MAG: hypothetical protein UY05_C0012G0007 [Candidatus Peregrinibacteria bacterium GW2011_GWA2_47_7]